MAGPAEAGRPGRGSVTVIAPGAASLAVRGPVTGPRQELRLIAADASSVYLELPARSAEPRVIVLSAADVPRLPNAVALTSKPDPGGWGAGSSDAWAPAEVWVGRGAVQVGRLTLRVLRWWDPAPVLGPLSRARLEQGAAALQRACASARHEPSLAGHDDPNTLAACCAEGDLAGAVEAAERITGLGPGLAPGGDNMICGLLLALRLLGGAIPGGTRAVWLADWLGAAVTSDASLRTTSLGATLLYCAAHGQATAEVSAVLLALAGQHPLGPAVRTLLAAGQPPPAQPAAPHVVPAQPAGADLAWGLLAGCRAALALAQPGR